MFYPGIDEIRQYAKEFNVIPVSMEVNADMDTPISIFKRLEDSSFCFLLESVEGGEKWARYSFIGRKPFLTVESRNGITTAVYRDGHIDSFEGNPIEIIKKLMSDYRGAKVPGLPRFNGGAVGFFGYDTARYFEDLPNLPEDDLGLPELHFMFADEVVAFDHLKQKLHIIVNMQVKGSVERSYAGATERIKEIYRELQTSRWKMADTQLPGTTRIQQPSEVKSNLTREEFCNNVKKAKEYIRNGDIFQVVLSQRLSTRTSSDPLNVYRALRLINPGPYMYYLKFNGYTLAGSSPEMLVRVEDGLVETCPIAGTRKRGATEEEDIRLGTELLEDEKERAEHIMLVDLGRNDIGKVSKFGSVKVKDFMHIERYSHVMHIVSLVQGRLRPDRTVYDALAAVLPAGTLSGAPKVRAMQIIDELEKTKRSQYGGAVGYLSFNGSLDSCITIRTILFKEGTAYVQAGAGIVADSVPETEYEETVNKAMAMLKAIKEADGLV